MGGSLGTIRAKHSMRLATIFVAVCVFIIAGSAGALGYLYFGLNASQAATLGSVTLAVLALYNFVSARLGLRSMIGTQLADLSRATTDLARQLAEMGRRLAALETKVENALDQTRAVTDPLTLEVGELGILVKRLAETVDSHQGLIDALAQSVARPRAPAAAAAASEVAPPRSEVASSPGAAPSRAIPLPVIRSAIEESRIDLYLQPIVSLPQRKVRYYEALARLRTETGEVLNASDFISQAESDGLMPKLDYFVAFRCVAIVRRLLLKSREIGVFCNLSPATLNDASAFSQFLDFMDANRAIASALIFEFSQNAVRAMGRAEYEALAELAGRGYRFSMDNLADLRVEPGELANRGFRFVKVHASRLLHRPGAVTGENEPAGFSDLLGRFGIDLIADRIETESNVIDLLDHDVRYGQGFLFSPPRPVRAEALQLPERSEQMQVPAAKDEDDKHKSLSLHNV